MPFPIAASVGLNVLGGLLGGRSAKRAARERERAYADASNIVSGAYDTAAGYFDPRLDQERAAMARVNALLGLPGGEEDIDQTEILRNTPGYQFRLSQGAQARERLAAASGGLISGNTLAALEEYGQGLADQTFNDYLDRVLGLQSQGVDSVLAGLSVDRGNALADLRLGAGGARASGIEGATRAFASALGNVGNVLSASAARRDLQNILRGTGAVGFVPRASASSAYGLLPTYGVGLV